MNFFFQFLLIALNVYSFILLARALISWFNVDPYNPIVRFLYDVTEPVLQPIRQLVPPSGGMDLSILIAFLVIIVLRQLLRQMAIAVL